jgi:hypothetical protein
MGRVHYRLTRVAPLFGEDDSGELPCALRALGTKQRITGRPPST